MRTYETLRRSGHVLALFPMLVAPAAACTTGSSFASAPSDASTTMDKNDGGASGVTIVPPAQGGAQSDDAGATGESVDGSSGVPLACSGTELACDGGCVPNSISNCGMCGSVCPGTPGGTATCTSSGSSFACDISCNTNYTPCPGTVCVNLQSDGTNCDRCGHTCEGAACQAGQCQSWIVTSGLGTSTLLVPGSKAGSPAHANIATDGRYVVWTDSAQGVLEKSAAPGATDSVGNLSPSPGSVTGAFGAIAIANGTVVWTEWDVNGGVSVWSATEGQPNTGAQRASLAQSAGDIASGIAYDPSIGAVYFAITSGTNGTENGGIYKCNLSNGMCGLLSALPAQRDYYLANDVTFASSKLFWTDSGSDDIWEADYAHSPSPAAIAMGQDVATLVAADATNVYWANVSYSDAGGTNFYSIQKQALSSDAAPVVLVPTNQASLVDIATDGANVYVTSGDPGALSLQYVPVAGGSLHVLANGARPFGFAVGGGIIAWLDSNGSIGAIAAP
jgi:hypothetical protein